MLAQEHLENLVGLEGFHANDAHLPRGDEHDVVRPFYWMSKLVQEAVLPDLLPSPKSEAGVETQQTDKAARVSGATP